MKKKKIIVLSLIITALILAAGCTSTTPTTGIIDLNSTPDGARVILDGVDTGQVTPIILTGVEAGTHTIQLDKFHYEIWEDTVIVIANDTIYRNPPLTYASTQYITLQPGAEGIDSTMQTALPYINYGSLTMALVGNTVSSILRTYIKFDLSTVPANARITDADLRLYQHDTFGSDNFTIGLYNVTGDWDESTITWNLQPTSSTDAEITNNITAGATTWKSWDIDTLVQGWLDGTITNYGMMLKDTEETLVSTVTYFYTSDYTTDTTLRPKLEIDYYIP